MGARPIAILDSLRFGPIAAPEGAETSDLMKEVMSRNRYLFGGVVSGIGGYGNCLGIPTVGGEVYFEDAYSANPLVNAMCVGVAPVEKLASAKAEGVGNVLMLVGADTGRDGIHGASGLASRTDPNARFDELRPAVQVGNPFLEKMLLEACLELAHNHANWITGIQDLGAAGLSASSAESAARAGTGLVIDVSRVPRREEGMTPYEVMLSESQERMLIIAREAHVEHVAALFERWEVPWAVIGSVTGDQVIRILDNGREVAALPVQTLVDAPEYTREGEPSEELYRLQSMDLSGVPDVTDARAAFLRLLASPNIASKHWIYRQYDQSVLSNTVVQAGADAAVLRIKGTQKGIAVSTDCNGRYCHIDPYIGGAIAVAEAARNVVCAGAVPVAVTDCLNFGNPERPDVYFQMQSVVHGIAEACNALGTPVISGNVSLYNETGGQPVHPTPVIGMLGILDDVTQHRGMGFVSDGDEVFVVGSTLEQPVAALGGSEYLKLERGMVGGKLSIDLALEGRVQRTTLAAIRQGFVTACHDCSDGGLAVALAEMCLAGGKGLDASGTELGRRLDAALFGETQSRIIVTIRPHDRARLLGVTEGLGVPAYLVGRVTDEARLRLGPLDVPVEEMRRVYEGALERALAG
jgi:phosphoribosylformylglycinamidine synthase